MEIDYTKTLFYKQPYHWTMRRDFKDELKDDVRVHFMTFCSSNRAHKAFQFPAVSPCFSLRMLLLAVSSVNSLLRLLSTLIAAGNDASTSDNGLA